MGESVICLHPPLEERGRIKSDEDPVFRISLKDCLACSGCAITEDEITLLAHQDPSRILSQLNDNRGFAVIVSTMAIANLSASRKWSLSESFASIASFFRSRGSSFITTDSLWQIVWRKLILQLFHSNTIPKPFIISRCAAAVLFFERKTTHAAHLATIKPFTQLFGIHMKSQFPYILQLAACYDRKLETGRFPGSIDAVLAINEIAEQFEKTDPNEFGTFPCESDVEWLLRKLGEGDLVQTVSGRTIEYRIGEWQGALICGEAALRRLCANIDRGSCTYDIVEADFCPAACASGGGLIRATTPSERQQLVRDTIAAHKLGEAEIENEEEIERLVAAVKGLEITTHYKSIERKPEQDFTF